MKRLLLVLIFALLLGAVGLAAHSQVSLPESAAPTAQITFLPLPGLTLIDKGTYQFDAGAVDTIRIPHWEHVFTLKNTTSKPVILTGLRGSCGCETLLLQKGDALVPTAHLAPGEEATIHLKVNLHAGQPGAVRKYVWVDGPPTVSGQAAPLATLEVDLLLQKSVSFSPRLLDFGKVEAGAGAKQSLTVSFDPALFPGSGLPPLVSADPNIKASPLGPVQQITEAGKLQFRQAFQVTLSPSAHAGRISGQLWLDLPHSSDISTASAARVDLAVTGEVAGAIDALPASLFFGSLPAGKPVTRTVVLSLAAVSAAPSLSVTSSNSWLVAVLDQPTALSKHRLLSITLTDKAPLGPLQGKVTVALPKGEHLDIPIVAELTK